MSAGRRSAGALGWARIGAAVAGRPRLWSTALRAGASLARRGWWRRAPFLPVPDRRWLRFRLETAYGGDGTAVPTVDDVITWLEWRRRFPGAA